MAGVVILHAQEDGAPAHALAAKLRALGFETVTDAPPGPGLRRAIDNSEAVVALWSPRSAPRADLVGEAAYARDLGVLIHARMQNMPAPAQFSADPTIDLTGWRGEDSFPGWRNLQAAVEGVVQANDPVFGAPERAPPRTPAPPPARQPAYRAPAYEEDAYREPAYEEPSYRDPAPRAPAYEPPPHYAPQAQENGGGGGLRLALIGIVTFLVVAGVGIGGYSFIQGGQSNAAAEAAWNALDKSDPRALREFLDGDNVGRFERPAEIALEGLEVEAYRTAREADTVEALEGFLENFPESRHGTLVRGRIAELRQGTLDTVAAPVEPELQPVTPADMAPIPDMSVPVEPAPDSPALDGQSPPDAGGPVILTPSEEAAPPPELSRRFEGAARLSDGELDAQAQR
ncbi:MAG: toll/interleukin-1 receptor domain-containing protein [Hyphomonadaceae bacterium]